MIYIAHRGNIDGPCPEFENNPDYIAKALDLGFDVEVDVWVNDDGLIYLGHDKPTYQVSIDYLKNDRFWCHAKNLAALELMLRYRESIHCFSHDKDDHVLTSQGIIWTYPGQDISNETIMCMPEATLISENELRKCKGICSDFVIKYKRMFESKRRIAILISGRIKCYEQCLKAQLERFYNEERNKETVIDIFVSLNSVYNNEVMEFVKSVQPTKIYTNVFRCNPKYIQFPYVRPEFESQRHLLGNFISHAYNNMIAFDLMKKYISDNGVNYEYIVLFRADIDALELPIVDEVKKNTIYYPSQNIYDPRWINMAILIGDIDTMHKYCSLYLNIDNYIYNDKMILHPETLATYHIDCCGLDHKTFSYDYVLHKDRRMA